MLYQDAVEIQKDLTLTHSLPPTPNPPLLTTYPQGVATFPAGRGRAERQTCGLYVSRRNERTLVYVA